MTKRSVRVALFLLFVAAIGATAYLFWNAEREASRAAATARAIDDRAREAALRVADLRAAQQAYVAAGQGEEFWSARTTALIDELKTAIAALRSDATASSTASALDDASAALQDFEQMNGRAREYARDHQAGQASNLIFSDGAELTRKLGEAIELARTSERAERDAGIAALNRREAFSLGAAGAAALAIVLLLLPAGEHTELPVPSIAPSPARQIAPAPVAVAAAKRPTLDEEGWTPARPRPVGEAAPAPAPAVAPAAAKTAVAQPTPVVAVPAPAPSPAPPRIDLAAVARLCGDLARVVDTRTLPTLLEHAAGVLDASGIVLWVADPDARELAPIITHGYPQHLVTRLGTIARDAENATAAALRTSLLQTVKGDSISNGAVAAPLVTATGCVGVMAAEVRKGGEQNDQVLAAAGIIAAQLATLVGPPSTRAKAEAAG